MEETTKNEGKVCKATIVLQVRAEEIVKFRRVVGSDWLEYIYTV